MKALFIGGTGRISMDVTRRVAESGEWELWLVNRGSRNEAVPEGVGTLVADIGDEARVRQLTEGMEFDVVADFIAYEPAHVERDFRLFGGRTRQYIFVSSASAYQKPPQSPVITEETPLENPFWEYSRQKIACERRLWQLHRDASFPVTIVRPSHTYCERSLPLAVHGRQGAWQVLRRMMDGKPIIVPGDGTSLWTVTHSSDFAKGFLGLMGNPQALGEAFHITSGELLCWNQIYATIATALGAEFRPCHVPSAVLAEVGSRYDLRGSLLGDKAHSVIFDNTKLRRLVPSFRPTVPFSQGAPLSVSHFLSHPELQQADPEFDAWCDGVIARMEKLKEI